MAPGPNGQTMASHLSAALDTLTAHGRIDRWWPSIYEPETAAFGGHPGIDIAHEFFCADSRAIITMLNSNDTALGRRGLSLLLCATLMRAAHLEWYEQGDVWHRITHDRPLPHDVPAAALTGMAIQVRRRCAPTPRPTAHSSTRTAR